VGPARDRRPDLRQPVEPVAGAARDAPAARDRRPDLGQPDRPVAATARDRRPDLRPPDRPTGLAPRSRTLRRSALCAVVSIGATARGRGSRTRAGAAATATRTIVERPAGAQPAIAACGRSRNVNAARRGRPRADEGRGSRGSRMPRW
jgi:hypothetical protein